MQLKKKIRYKNHSHCRNNNKLEGCIDDERIISDGDGDANVRKRFFRNNFVIFRHRSKRIAFLESVNFSTCMQVFNFRDGHVTTFRHPSGGLSAKCLVTDSPDYSTFGVSTFHRYHWFGVKLFPVSCAQDSRGVP